MLMKALRKLATSLLSDGYHVSNYSRDTWGEAGSRTCRYSFTLKLGEGNKTLTRLVKKFMNDDKAELTEVWCDRYKNWSSTEGEPDHVETCRLSFSVPETCTLVTESEQLISKDEMRLTCESYEEKQDRYRAFLLREAQNLLDAENLEVRAVGCYASPYSMGKRVNIEGFIPFEEKEGDGSPDKTYD